MAESLHYQQLGKFMVLFQELEQALVEFNGAIAGEDYAAEILPAETEYPRLVESTGVIFSRFLDRLRRPDAETGTRFHELMEKCLEIGVLRNRLIRSTYALLVRSGDAFDIAQKGVKRKFNDASRGQAVGEDPSLESFDPYFQRIADVLAELESFQLQVTDWKPAGK